MSQRSDDDVDDLEDEDDEDYEDSLFGEFEGDFDDPRGDIDNGSFDNEGFFND